MKIKQANAGALTNFEVLDFLRSRGATSDPMGCLGSVAPSECKVFDYLVHSAACNQTRDAVNEFLKRCEKFRLAKAEKLNIINLRPSSQAEIYPIIEHCDKRLARDEAKGIDEFQELVDLVVEVLPPKPEEMLNEQEMPNETTAEQN